MRPLVKTALALSLAALVVALASRGLAFLAGAGLRAERLSGQAPSLALERPDGKRAPPPLGKVRVIQFWVSWCPPCAREVPDLLALRPELERDGDVQLDLVTLDNDWAEVRKFFRGPPPDGVVRTLEKDAYAKFGVSGLPETYIVSPKGALVSRFTGKVDWQASSARAALFAEVERARREDGAALAQGRARDSP